jgi:hypothetical protein
MVALSSQLIREDGAAAVDVLRPDIPTLAAAFELALQWKEPEQIHQPLQALLRLYRRLGWHHAATRVVHAVLARHPQAPVAWRVIWHHMGGEIVHNQHGYQLNSEHFSAAVRLASVTLPAGGVRNWLSVAANLCRALVARPSRQALDCKAQAALAHSLLMLLSVRFANGAGRSELLDLLCAAIVAARRSGDAEARLMVMVKMMSIGQLGGRPKVYAAMLRRMRADLKDAAPAYEARVLMGMSEAMIVTGQWDAAVGNLRRASAHLGALGYGYEVIECNGRLNSVLQHIGHFRPLMDNLWEDERAARRLEQSNGLRWTLIFKLQLLLRTGSGSITDAVQCLRAIHEIPTYRSGLEEIRLWAHEGLLLAAQGDVNAVLQRAQNILDVSAAMSGGRFYSMPPMGVITDALLFLALKEPAQTLVRKLARDMVRRYDRMSRGMGQFAVRRFYYLGVAAVLEGQIEGAVRFWSEGLARCAEDDLVYDRARIHWMLALYGEPAGRAAHEQAAAADFTRCAVAGPPYPFMPKTLPADVA